MCSVRALDLWNLLPSDLVWPECVSRVDTWQGPILSPWPVQGMSVGRVGYWWFGDYVEMSVVLFVDLI